MNNLSEFSRKTYEERKKEIDELATKVDEGVKEYLNSDKYKTLLNNINKFHQYSLNNIILISMQNPNATRVASFSAWDSKFHRLINKGEKGLKILCPVDKKVMVEQEKLDPITKQPLIDFEGNTIKETVEKNYKTFKVGYVFDESQTTQNPDKSVVDIEVVKNLKGDVAGYDKLVDAIKKISNTNIIFGNITGGAKGYYSPLDNTIVVKEGMDQKQSIKTLIHELAHSKLHNLDNELNSLPSYIKELQAESCAYIISNHFGIDTSDYSFPYVASWTEAKLEDIKDNLSIIKDISNSLIESIECELYGEKLTDKIREEVNKRTNEQINRKEKYQHHHKRRL